MSSAHATVVIWDGDKIINSFAVVLVYDVGPHVQPTGGKVHMCVQFVSPVSVVTEPF